MVNIADITSPINTGILILILICVAIVITTIMIILNTLVNGITTIINDIKDIPVISPKSFPIVLYNYYLPNGLPNLLFDISLGEFLCRVLMSCMNESQNKETFFPEDIVIVDKWKNSYLLQLPYIYILVFIETGSMIFSGIQTPYTDLNGKVVPEARVSSTWNNVYNEVKMPIYEKLLSLKNPNVIITGYGTGAPVASLMATALSISNMSICYYGIGSPRIGNNYFYECMNTYVQNRWDIVNVMDIIPNLPNFHDFAYSNHIYNINVASDNNHDLQTYLCGLSSDTCSNDVRWNIPMYSGNIKL